MASLIRYQFDFEAARKLPSQIRFGTSTWTYPGWQGLVYFKNYKNERDFKANCLTEYASFPWFRTAGIDSFFYSPPSFDTLQHYVRLVPKSFAWVCKVWEKITIPVYPRHPRYGRLAGSENPDFLNLKLLEKEVLSKYLAPEIRCHTGPFVFQFPPLDKEVLVRLEFLEQLRKFLAGLPAQFRYAVEVRNRELLTPDYFKILNRFNVTHCFNHWYLMPPLKEQMQCAFEAGGLEAPFFVARILTPLGVNYERAVKLFQPYNTIKQPNPAMRRDVARLVARALKRKAEAYIIVNNRCEGNAPMTIDAIGKMIVGKI